MSPGDRVPGQQSAPPGQHRGDGLEVVGLRKDYLANRGRQQVVRDVSFTIEAGHFYSLLGPSGCGKTTTLRCVAGLERSDGGEIRLAGTVLSGPGTHVPPERRDLGMVFQNYAIWPHLTVFENVAFPLRVARPRIARAQIARQVEETLALVQLSDLAGRPAVAMSGGQQQRLAVARALVRRPRLLLLDEPLSNLDAKLRDAMRGELRNLQRRLGITTLYVTHDQAEAMSMSDRVAVMADGQLMQEGTPQEIYHQPASRFVADFVGRANLVAGTVTERLAGGGIGVRALGVVLRTAAGDADPGENVTLALRPQGIRAHPTRQPGPRAQPGRGREPAHVPDLGDDHRGQHRADARQPLDHLAPQAPNVLAGVVIGTEFLGEIAQCQVRVGEATLNVRQDPLTPVQVGDYAFLEIAPQSCVVLRDRPDATFSS